ncbi:MAG TPA: MDR family oxidoreductase [Gammaproteobacteria bacterium]|nr:MDR family oxidoreductase [Gammaproteobacteria bacterium]
MFKALVLEADSGEPRPVVRELEDDALPAGDVTVAVAYSGLNFKDAMVLTNRGNLVRSYPHVPGIDLAGTVEASDHPDFQPGDEVLLNGWRVGEHHWGGLAGKARVRGEWLQHLPAGMSMQHAMAVGTAGLAAMLGLLALEDHDLAPSAQVLVTGASGGVGSLATALAAASGRYVTAVTGRPQNEIYLRGLGAHQVLDRSELDGPPERPLEDQRWAGCIDPVGGQTLAHSLAQMRYGAAVAAVGLAGGAKLSTTLLPFLLRGVSLLGIDSAACPMERRRQAWQRLASDLSHDRLQSLFRVASLAEVPELANELIQGSIRGRVVVDPGA